MEGECTAVIDKCRVSVSVSEKGAHMTPEIVGDDGECAR